MLTVLLVELYADTFPAARQRWQELAGWYLKGRDVSSPEQYEVRSIPHSFNQR